MVSFEFKNLFLFTENLGDLDLKERLVKKGKKERQAHRVSTKIITWKIL